MTKAALARLKVELLTTKVVLARLKVELLTTKAALARLKVELLTTKAVLARLKVRLPFSLFHIFSTLPPQSTFFYGQYSHFVVRR